MLRRNFRRVIAIEPHPDNFAVLRYVLRFCLVNHESVEAAVCEEDGKARLYIHDLSGSHTLLAKHPNIDKRSGRCIIVRTLTLATLIKTYGPADLVKVDVEGAEWQVLEGAESVLNLA